LRVARLLSGLLALRARRIIAGPVPQPMREDPHDCMRHGHGGFLPSQTTVSPPTRPPDTRWRFSGRPGTWHHDPAQRALALPRAPLASLACPVVVARRSPCPGRQARGRATATPVRAALREHVPGGDGRETGQAVALLPWRRKRRGRHPPLRVEGGGLPLQALHQRQCSLQQAPMVRSALARHGHGQLGPLAASGPHGQRGERVRGALPRPQRLQHPLATPAKKVRHGMGPRAVGRLPHRAEAIGHLGARLHQRDARPGQIAPGVHRRRRENARRNQPMRSACRSPRGIRVVGLFPGPLAH
jgi:hypothetical protein